VLAVVLILVAVVALVDPSFVSDIGLSEKLPRDPKLAAQRVLDTAPVIVRLLTHIFRSFLADGTHRMGTLVRSLSEICMSILLQCVLETFLWLLASAGATMSPMFLLMVKCPCMWIFHV
jgi:hypothetical protein